MEPVDVGLARGRRRRTPGLRREEVARLADISADYYARMRPQRAPQPSAAVVSTIARGLRLSGDERDPLMRLAGHVPSPRSSRTNHVAPALLRMRDRLHDTPALVVSDIGDTLAQNPCAVGLLGDQTRHTGHARSAYYRWFTDPRERQLYPERDHGRQSEVQSAALRAAISANEDDDRKMIVHPELGEIEVDCQKLSTDNRAQALVVLTATPGTEAADTLRLLSVVGTESFNPL